MANLTIEMPDDLVRQLEKIAAVERKSLQQLALGYIQSVVEAGCEYRPGSPAGVIRAVDAAPHPAPADVDDLNAAIASARLPVKVIDPSWY